MKELNLQELEEMLKKQKSYSFLNYGVVEFFVKKGILDLLDEATYKFIDLIGSSIFWKDLEGRYLGCNKYMLDIYGLKTREEAIGKKDDIALKGEALLKLQETDRLVIQEGKVIRLEEQGFLPGRPDKLLTFVTIKQPLLGDNNEIVGLFGNSIDITDLKEAQEKELLAQKISNDQLQFRQAVVQYSGTLSHDLKNPLHALGLHLEMIGFKIREEDRKKIADHLEKMKENIDRMVQTIDLSNKMIREVASENPKLLLQKKELRTLLLGSINNYEDQFNKTIIIEDLPNLEVMVDVITFFRIINNLIDNAQRQIAMKNKGKIFIRAEKVDGFCLIEIKDTAGGLTQEKIDQFFIAYKTKTAQNTGIGLQSCLRFAKEMQGDLSAKWVDGDCVAMQWKIPLA